MDKLSSILPNSPRIKSVDLSDAQPRRPGSPSFGIPTGMTASGRDRMTLSKPSLEDQPIYQNSKDRSAKIVSDVSKSFFEKRLTPQEEAPTLVSQSAVEEMGEALVNRSAAPAPTFAALAPTGAATAPVETLPHSEVPGRHIDLMA